MIEGRTPADDPGDGAPARDRAASGTSCGPETTREAPPRWTRLWLEGWRTRYVHLSSERPPDDVRRCVTQRMAKSIWSVPKGPARWGFRITKRRYLVHGRVYRDGNLVLYASPAGFSNPWLRTLRARVYADAEGRTVITGGFHANGFGLGHFAAFSAFISLFAVVGIAVLVGRLIQGDSEAAVDVAPLVAQPVLMLFAVWVLATLGVRDSMRAEDYLLRWLARCMAGSDRRTSSR